MMGHAFSKLARATGFTLIELVVVIVLIGITAVVMTPLFVYTVEGYVDTARRQDSVTTARLAIDRIDRELREAMPKSIRVSGGCLQFLPILASTTYLAPITGSVNTINVVAFPVPAATPKYVTIYPNDTAALYGGSNLGNFSSSVAAGSGQLTLTWTGAALTDSLTRRLYILGNPVSFCFVGGRLNRYESAVTPAQPAVASMGTGAMLVDSIDMDKSAFTLVDGSGIVNGFSAVKIGVLRNGETLILDHLVWLRNAL